MKAVIVAAGQSSRLRPLTKSIPKCLLEINGKTILDYSIDNLQSYGIIDIAVVVGYQKDQICQRYKDRLTLISNPFYTETNNLASLWFAKDFIADSPFIYAHSDLLYDREILSPLLQTSAGITLSVEPKPTDPEMMKVRLDGEKFIEMGKDIPLEKAYGEWSGIAGFSSESWLKFADLAEEILYNGSFNAYDAKAFNCMPNDVIKIAPFEQIPFIEIDDSEDWQMAQNDVFPRLQERW